MEAITQTTRVRQRTDSNKKYLLFYLLFTYGSFLAVALLYGFIPEVMTQLLGEINEWHPLFLFVLHTPTIGAFIIHYWKGGRELLLRFVKNNLPRRQDLKWIPIVIIGLMVYLFVVRWCCQLLGLAVPAMDKGLAHYGYILLINIVMEVGMLGAAWGWYGFVYPFLQRYIKNHLISGALTGVAFTLFLVPGIDFSESGIWLAFVVYLASLVIYSIILSYILDDTNNNVLFYILSFWIMSTGSKIDLYYFVWETQLIQTILFLVIWLMLHLYLNVFNQPKPLTERLNVFPDYLYKRTDIA